MNCKYNLWKKKIEELTNDDSVLIILEIFVRLALKKIEILKERSSVLEFVFTQSVRIF